MLTSILALFTGGSAPLIIGGVLLLSTATGTAYVTHRFDSAKLERVERQYAEQAAKDNAIALEQLQTHIAISNKVVAEAQQAATAREAQVNTLRKAIANAPKTRSCVDSPAIRALLSGLRGTGSNGRH
jgi:Tfp pilus assembly protein FimV